MKNVLQPLAQSAFGLIYDFALCKYTLKLYFRISHFYQCDFQGKQLCHVCLNLPFSVGWTLSGIRAFYAIFNFFSHFPLISK